MENQNKISAFRELFSDDQNHLSLTRIMSAITCGTILAIWVVDCVISFFGGKVIVDIPVGVGGIFLVAFAAKVAQKYGEGKNT